MIIGKFSAFRKSFIKFRFNKMYRMKWGVRDTEGRRRRSRRRKWINGFHGSNWYNKHYESHHGNHDFPTYQFDPFRSVCTLENVLLWKLSTNLGLYRI